ncbi:MAG: hypothetical protein Q7K45_02735 [Nanoarchaeota archaeon]|nr:hypothetical protein [Nanoarchaeota archaeon]
MTIFTHVRKEDALKLLKKGFIQDKPKTAYEELRLNKEDITLILYTSGKLLVQGPPEAVDKITKQLQKIGIGFKMKEQLFRQESGWIIGSDESLKGDTFGGIVVAAVKADNTIREKLQELGVADSKTLHDKEILPMAEKIKHIAGCEIRSILPEEYNAFKGNVTEILNWLHRECAKDLETGKHVVDKYPGCAVGDIQEEKAESKYIEVAAASVLARAAALQQLDYVSMMAGFEVPKGSTHVKEALMKLKEQKLDFRKFVKVDFRNVREFLGKNSGHAENNIFEHVKEFLG